jgi:hypothetical protein
MKLHTKRTAIPAAQEHPGVQTSSNAVAADRQSDNMIGCGFVTDGRKERPPPDREAKAKVERIYRGK